MDNHPLEDLSQIYLLQKQISNSTLKSYKIAFKKYIDYLKENNIIYAKTSDIIRYRQHRRALGDSTYYIYIHISVLKGFYHFLSVNQKKLNIDKLYAYDIVTPIKNEKINHRINKPILTVKQAKHMILHTKRSRKYIWHYRDHAIISLMMTSGVRRFEIIYAKKSDYQIIDEKAILYIKKKRSADVKEFVKISKGTQKALNDYLDKRKDDNPYLFISHKNISKQGHLSRTFFADMFPRILKSCGLEDKNITPNVLRQTAGMINLLRGGTLASTQSFLRHKHIESTLVYQEHLERLKDDSAYKIDAFILKEEDLMSDKDFFNYFDR